VAGEHEHALAAVERLHERLEAVDANERSLLRRRHPAEAREFDDQLPQMRVVRLGEAFDFV